MFCTVIPTVLYWNGKWSCCTVGRSDGNKHTTKLLSQFEEIHLAPALQNKLAIQTTWPNLCNIIELFDMPAHKQTYLNCFIATVRQHVNLDARNDLCYNRLMFASMKHFCPKMMCLLSGLWIHALAVKSIRCMFLSPCLSLSLFLLFPLSLAMCSSLPFRRVSTFLLLFGSIWLRACVLAGCIWPMAFSWRNKLLRYSRISNQAQLNSTLGAIEMNECRVNETMRAWIPINWVGVCVRQINGNGNDACTCVHINRRRHFHRIWIKNSVPRWIRCIQHCYYSRHSLWFHSHRPHVWEHQLNL